jgi:hypothetical protein
LHCRIVVTWSVNLRVHSLHVENKSVAKAVSTVIGAGSWNILWLALAPALLLGTWEWLFI